MHAERDLPGWCVPGDAVLFSEALVIASSLISTHTHTHHTNTSTHTHPHTPPPHTHTHTHTHTHSSSTLSYAHKRILKLREHSVLSLERRLPPAPGCRRSGHASHLVWLPLGVLKRIRCGGTQTLPFRDTS